MHVQIHARSARAFATVALAIVALGACSKDKNESAGDVTPAALLLWQLMLAVGFAIAAW